MRNILSIDPGMKKCGLILADLDTATVLDGRVVSYSAVINCIEYWRSIEHFDNIILGNGTSSKFWLKKLKGIAPIQVVEEKGTTLRARERYWEIWPPGIWLRWLPRGLIVPSTHLDAVAALVLLEDYLNQKLHWTAQRDFRIWHEL